MDMQKKLMPSPKGKLIVLEGVDASGKVTQAGHLYIRLRNEGKQTEMLSFPTYHKTKYGRLVSEYLAGAYGDKSDVPPEIVSMFYAVDRYQLKEDILEKLESGVYFIFDRYTQSNIFQAAKHGLDKGTALWEWIKNLESRLPQPDAVIFLNVLPDFSRKLLEKRDSKNPAIGQGVLDVHERDLKYQELVREMYLKTAEKENWIVINCCKETTNGITFRDPTEIHEEIYARLKERGVV